MIIDLCCGLGRFESPSEAVISIDIDRKVKPTIIADVRYIPLRQRLKPRLCHASPPCTYFSQARLISSKEYDCLGVAESLELVAACFRAFDYLEPWTWTLENPQGLLSRILPPIAKIIYQAYDYKTKKTCLWSNNRSLKRALIPQDVRQKILSICKE